MFKRHRHLLGNLLLLAGLMPGIVHAQLDTNVPIAELRVRNRLLKTPIRLSGRVLDANGQPLMGAVVKLDGLTNVVGTNGIFFFKRVSRTNVLLTISAPGFRDELLPVDLALPVRSRLVQLDAIPMTATGAVRMLFGGDTMFGRRFLDPNNVTPRGVMPPNDTNALIQVVDPLPGSIAAVQCIKPFFHEADFSSVNFETPVTDDPLTPHPDKAYDFFTLPGSLPALLDLGVSYAGQGNNHVYDYLELGIVDTRSNLDLAGIPHSGSGLTPAEAYAPYRTDLGGHPYSFVAACFVSGSQHPTNYVAGPTKGGAADARVDADFTNSIQSELIAGRIPIMQIHGGKEYSFQPVTNMQGRITLAAQAGAALVVCHHPHVAQGFGKVGNVLTVHCLGNLIMDQDRLETMLGLLVRVDIDGTNVHAMRAIPVYLEEFQPRPIGGRLASDFLRRIGESSRPFGVLEYPYNSQGWISLSTNDYTVHDRTNVVKLTIPPSGVAVLDLRLYETNNESLIAAQTIAGTNGLTGQMGRDLLNHGDFEEYDVDSDSFDVPRWDVSSVSRYVSVIRPFRGLACIRSTRTSLDHTDSVLPLRNRVRVFGDAIDQPNKDLSLFGYITGQHAGAVSVVARIEASAGTNIFGEEIIYQRRAGSYKWQPFLADIPMPPDDPSLPPPTSVQQARAVQVFFHHSPQTFGAGVVGYDELAIINWEETFDLDAGGTFVAPHPRDFIRVTGVPGVYTFTLTFRSFKPAIVGQ
jgi:poly-gamma-glutamate capsule biosynthesis protein CapA/YwtB (metallophosphatase superfamily)